VDARGTMDYEWGESCEGWTIEQRYRLKMRYGEAPHADIVSSFVTWESKDGLRYRFNQKQTRNGEVDQDIRGEARLDAPERGGIVEFTKPKPQTLKLEAGVLFPSSHTILLIDTAHEGDNFLSRQVFDGATDENAVQISAAIGVKVAADDAAAKLSPLLQRPGWRIRLAFFAADRGRKIGRAAIDESVGRAPDQPKPGDAVGFAGEERVRGAEQRLGQLGRRREPAGPGAQAKIGGLELQCDRPGGQCRLL